jgi:predicted TIM-barrel fold metal-dependent hydrolase
MQQILKCAAVPNIYIKLSGFAYAAEHAWNFPYPAVQEIVKAEYQAFGAHRMCWGSDYPVVRYAMTYRQSLEAFRTHCAFVPAADQELILGRTLARLLPSPPAG